MKSIQVTKKTVGIVHAHFLIRKGMVSLLEKYREFENIIEASSGKQLMDKLKVRQPDVIFLAAEMPEICGIEITELLKKKHPGIKIIIMLSDQKDEELIYHLVEKGAHGFFTMNTDTDTVAQIIHTVFSKGFYFCDMATRAMTKAIVNGKARENSNILSLSERELQVIRLICAQHTNKEIADILCISPRTVDTYRENIFIKTGAKNVVGVALYALKNNLVDLNHPGNTFYTSKTRHKSYA